MAEHNMRVVKNSNRGVRCSGRTLEGSCRSAMTRLRQATSGDPRGRAHVVGSMAVVWRRWRRTSVRERAPAVARGQAKNSGARPTFAFSSGEVGRCAALRRADMNAS